MYDNTSRRFTPVWVPLVLYSISLILCIILSLDRTESALESILFIMPFLIISILYLFADRFGDKTVFIGVIALVVFMNMEILLSFFPQVLSIIAKMTVGGYYQDVNPACLLFPTPFYFRIRGWIIHYPNFFYLLIPVSFMAGNTLLILGCFLFRSKNIRNTQSGGTISIGKKKTTAIVLSIFLGGFGIDRIYLGYVGSGVLKLLTWGGFGIWSIIDLILICSNRLKPADGSEYIDVFAHNAMRMEQMMVPMVTAPLPVTVKDNKREATDMLEKLHVLFERGIISSEEYDEKRKKYVSQL